MNTSKKYIRQSNITSKALMKISSATAYKLIKYGTYLLNMKFANKENKKSIEEYRDMNLFDSSNWENVDWNDFKCTFAISDYAKDMTTCEGGKQRTEIQKMVKEVTKETIYLHNDTYDQWFPWFVSAKYIHNKGRKDHKIEFTFNPGVIGVALLENKQYSIIDLQPVGKLKSYYSIRLYELMKSYYNTKGRYGNPAGTWKTEWFTIAYMRKYMNAEDLYKNDDSHFESKCLKKAMNEINKLSEELKLNMFIEMEKNKQGRPKQIRFTGKENTITVPIRKTDTKKLIEEKVEKNEADIEREAIIAKYKKNGMWPEICEKVYEKLMNDPMKKNLFMATKKEELFNGHVFFDVYAVDYIQNEFEK